MGFQNERLICFMTDQNGRATVECVAIATQFVSATDGIDYFRLSHFCVATAMCLFVTLFFPFLLKYVGCFIKSYSL